MSSSHQNKNLQRLLKAEENANQLIRDAKSQRTKIYKDIEAQVTKTPSTSPLLLRPG